MCSHVIGSVPQAMCQGFAYPLATGSRGIAVRT